jgi:hypothetical protein
MSAPALETLDWLRFDPSDGEIVRDPPGRGYGYWAGGHKAFRDPETGRVVLFYREREPLELGRGGRCAIAVSDDGVVFEDVWSADKSAFAANSIEVGHCVRDPSGEWRLYVSYEYAGAGYWRIDLMCAASLEAFDVQGRRTVFMPFDYGMRSLKDPVVYLRDGKYWIYVAGASRARPREDTLEDNAAVRASGREATLLAVSDDGIYFPELHFAFEAPNTDTWNGRRARINSVIPLNGGYLGFYDGGRTSYDMYEEWCGLAWSDDGRSFERYDQAEPWVRSPHGCVRYVYALDGPDEVLFYYEYTREDGAHELRVSRIGKPH